MKKKERDYSKGVKEMEVIRALGQIKTDNGLMPVIMGILNRRIETPKGVQVFRRGDKKPSGKTTGSASRCRMDGCPGYRISVVWNNGEKSRPCSKGMILTKKGWKII